MKSIDRNSHNKKTMETEPVDQSGHQFTKGSFTRTVPVPVSCHRKSCANGEGLFDGQISQLCRSGLIDIFDGECDGDRTCKRTLGYKMEKVQLHTRFLFVLIRKLSVGFPNITPRKMKDEKI